jgi:NADPH:quinone reductase-like Zn-dependent oxidoreductase
MKAVVVDAPGGPEVLQVRDVPIPVPADGWVLIKVEAFGLNRSELHFRSGVAYSGSFPRIPGLEAVGTVVEAPGTDFAPGTQVAALMGGMGRNIDGGYAEYVSVPTGSVIPFTSALAWDVLGAIPEMLQTAAGSLRVGLEAVDGQSLLIRGGTSSIGLALAVLASSRGMTVLSTTRNPAKADLLEAAGVDHIILDDGDVASKVRAIYPGGVDGAVELVGTNVMRDTLRSVRTGGTVCFTGMLSDQWTIPDFYPMDWLPNGVRLTAYSGEAADLSASDLQAFIDAVESGHARVPVGRVYAMSDIAQAHRDMEAGIGGGKLVVIPQ